MSRNIVTWNWLLSCFLDAENSIVDSPILKRTAGVGRRHPLASVELDPIMDGLDVEDSGSCDDVLDGSGSVKSGGMLLHDLSCLLEFRL